MWGAVSPLDRAIHAIRRLILIEHVVYFFHQRRQRDLVAAVQKHRAIEAVEHLERVLVVDRLLDRFGRLLGCRHARPPEWRESPHVQVEDRGWCLWCSVLRHGGGAQREKQERRAEKITHAVSLKKVNPEAV